MTRSRRSRPVLTVLVALGALSLVGAGGTPVQPPAPATPTAPTAPPAPHVTRVHVDKSSRTMKLYDGDTVVATYAVAVGKGGLGPKKREGDLVTPVGKYRIVKHVPSHLRIFMQIDYPNADDRARFDEAKKRGELPKNATIGGDIGIHGEPPEAKPFKKAEYLSHGCVVVEDAEIDQIAKLVPDGTAVEIED